MMRYRSKDFRRAIFAEHPSGNRALRQEDTETWTDQYGDKYEPAEMAGQGWTPVRPKPVITDRELEEECWAQGLAGSLIVTDIIERLGVAEIVHEKTETEKIEDAIHASWPRGLGAVLSLLQVRELAERLARNGITTKENTK